MKVLKAILLTSILTMGCFSNVMASGSITNLSSDQGSIKEVSTLYRTITVNKNKLMLSDPLVIKDSKGQLVNHKYLKSGMNIKYAFIKNSETLTDIETEDGKPYDSEGNITHIIIMSDVPKENLMQ